MKERNILPATLLVFIAIFLWWLMRRPADRTTERTDPAAISQSNLSHGPPPQYPSKAHVAAISQAAPGDHPVAWAEEWRSLQNQWRTPIEYYGKVVDENANPVAGAQADFGCNDLSREGTSNYHSTSDGDGAFSLTDISGKLLSVSVAKAGYYSSKRDNGFFTYAGANANFVPDPNNPVLFHLRKKTAGEPLITADYPGFAHIAQLRHDGTAVELDLLKGAQVAAGDGQLRLEFWRDASDKSAGIFDWKARLSASGGGLFETDEEFGFRAPEGGYQSSFDCDRHAGQESGLEGRNKKEILYPSALQEIWAH